MKSIIGQRLPVSKEAVITLKRPTTQMIMVGTPLEAYCTFFDGQLGRVCYKYPWHQRVWYSFLSRHGMWKGVDGNLQSSS